MIGRWVTIIAMGCIMCGTVYGQEGVVGDFLAGELVKPEVGAWSWYNVKDVASGTSFAVRIAIVGEEKVSGKKGYWLELEVVPMLGYRSVYKMLLTGPARDPANIHKMLRREGAAAVEDIKMPAEKEKNTKKKDKKTDEPAAEKPVDKKLIGREDIDTPSGPVHADHYELVRTNAKTDAWLNEEVKPMGIARLKSPEGELTLKSFGTGGPDARSVINESPLPGKPAPDDSMKVEVHVDKHLKDAGKKTGVKEAQPDAPQGQ